MQNVSEKEVVSYLKKDKTLAKVINRTSFPRLSKHTDHYLNLLEIIVNQQLSQRVGDVIFNRLLTLLGSNHETTPELILELSDEQIRACGLSSSKIRCMKQLSAKVVAGQIDFSELETLDDEQVIEQLTTVKGIGRWSAEMFLIFSFQRTDIFSVRDLGLRTAVAQLYKVSLNDHARMEKIASKWSPYKSFASLYLWQSLDLVV